MNNNYTTITINWINYHFLNLYSFWKEKEEIEKEFETCIISEDLIDFARES